MIKMILAFLVVFALLYFLIPQYRNLTGQEKWDFVKLLSYSLVCAILSMCALTLLVVLF